MEYWTGSCGCDQLCGRRPARPRAHSSIRPRAGPLITPDGSCNQMTMGSETIRYRMK